MVNPDQSAEPPSTYSGANAQLIGRNLTFGYQSDKPLVQGLSVTLQGGQLCALVGPNAAGKSTLLRLLIGQLRPWRGLVTLDGQNVTQLNAQQRAQQICYVPQRASASFAFTVEQVVTMGRFAMPAAPSAVEHAIEICHLSPLRACVYRQLSVGQQQRVLLARAIAQSNGKGRAMLLDEPGSAMDLWHLHRMMQTLVGIARSGMAVLVVLHDPNLAARYADTAWAMDEGQIRTAGPWHAVLCPEVLEPLYRIRLRSFTGDKNGRPVFSFETPVDPTIENRASDAHIPHDRIGYDEIKDPS